MKNTLGDLNSYLFAQLDALSNPDLTGDKLKEELERSKAITDVSKTIIDNAKVVLEAKKCTSEYCLNVKDMPNMLEG